MRVQAGQWIEVRSKEEILATLDKDGRLDGLPFQPQMFQFCGQRIKVYKRAHKTCDWVYNTGGRLLENGLHLENVRCDGAAYAGCQSACLLYWKEEWVKAVDGESGSAVASNQGCTEQDVIAGTKRVDPVSGETFYRCQATDVPNFTTPLPWWNLRQYAEDVSSGNANVWQLIKAATYFSYNKFAAPHRARGAPARWLYDQVQKIFGGTPYPERTGLAARGKTPRTAKLNLQPGEWVRVKPYAEILATLDDNQKNRGLYFDKEAVPYCGGVYRVSHRVTDFLDESTGKPMKLTTDAVVLENVWCRSKFSDRRVMCPRAIYPWWRDIWLERVEAPLEAVEARAMHAETTAR
ncbi:MAG: hypothetical protein ABW199_01360 [Caulobacterales bacterium]